MLNQVNGELLLKMKTKTEYEAVMFKITAIIINTMRAWTAFSVVNYTLNFLSEILSVIEVIWMIDVSKYFDMNHRIFWVDGVKP